LQSGESIEKGQTSWAFSIDGRFADDRAWMHFARP
jgi:hypothetical protein